MMRSDEAALADEEEATTLETLIKKIKEVVKAKLFWSSDPVAANTVHFWATQVVGVLQDARRHEQGQQQQQRQDPQSRATLVNAHFPTFLLKVLYANLCFNELKHFVCIMRTSWMLSARPLAT